MAFDSWGGLLLVALLIGLKAFLAVTESALTSVRRSRLRQWRDEGVRWAGLVERTSEDSRSLLTTIYLASILVQFAAAAFAVLVLVPPVSGWLAQIPSLTGVVTPLAVILVVSVLALAMLVLGELFPKSLALRDPEVVALRVTPVFRVVSWLLSPVVRLLVIFSRLAESLSGGEHPGVGVPSVTEEQIKTMVDAGEEEGVIEEDEKEMIFSIFEFGDTLAREIMVPRIDVTALDVTASLDEAIDVMLDKGFSRIPVYRDTIDNVIGLCYAKDLLRHLWGGTTEASLQPLLRPAYFVPESKELDELLQELQAQKIHLAVVVDEYGGMAGIVTIEDIIEEIVGEIMDEHDSEEPLMTVIDDETLLVDARLEVENLEEYLNMELPKGEFESVGGFIIHLLGRIPDVKEKVTFEDLEITIQQADQRKIHKVLITHKVLPDSPAEEKSLPY